MKAKMVITKRAVTGALFVGLTFAAGTSCGGNQGAQGGSEAGAGGEGAGSGTRTSGSAEERAAAIKDCPAKADCMGCCTSRISPADTESHLPYGAYLSECFCKECGDPCDHNYHFCSGESDPVSHEDPPSACTACRNTQNSSCSAQAEQACVAESATCALDLCTAACGGGACKHFYALVEHQSGSDPPCTGSQALADAYTLCMCTWSTSPSSPSDPAGCSEFCAVTTLCGGTVPLGDATDCNNCEPLNCYDQSHACAQDL